MAMKAFLNGKHILFFSQLALARVVSINWPNANWQHSHL